MASATRCLRCRAVDANFGFVNMVEYNEYRGHIDLCDEFGHVMYGIGEKSYLGMTLSYWL